MTDIGLAVMSLWTPPGVLNAPGEAVRWSLATCLLRRQFARLRLVTDTPGAAWAQALGLPFDEITTELDALDPALSPLWALGKIAAYSAMTEPFLHFDADVFLWRAFDRRILRAAYVAQHRARWVPEDFAALIGWDIPEHWRDALRRRDDAEWNFGTFGGHAWADIARHYREVLHIIALNQHRIPAHNPSMLCRWLEQWSLARHVPSPDQVTCLFPTPADTRYHSPGYYDHFVGSAKYKAPLIRRFTAALNREWPGQYQRIAQQAPCT